MGLRLEMRCLGWRKSFSKLFRVSLVELLNLNSLEYEWVTRIGSLPY